MVLLPDVAHGVANALNSVELLIRGAIVGLIIAAPVGPVNVLCVQRTIVKGWWAGIVSGLGSAIADTIYGAIAGFSISLVIQFLIKEEHWIRLFGGCILILIGVWYYFRKPLPLQKHQSEEDANSDLASTFLLTLTNPTTVLSFLAVMAVLHLAEHRPWWLTMFLVLGIFCGSMLWWILLTGVVNRFRDKFSDSSMQWMNRVAGLAIGTFGIITLLLSRSQPR